MSPAVNGQKIKNEADKEKRKMLSVAEQGNECHVKQNKVIK